MVVDDPVPRCHPRGVFIVARDRFEELVAEAMDAVPEPFARTLGEIAVTVSERAPRGDFASGLYGLYLGGPIGESYPVAPPRQIVIYMFPMLLHVADEPELREQIRVTLLHELGHAFGMDHDDLHRVGYL